MVVSGVPEPRADHAEALAALALDMRDALAGLVDPKGRPVPIRIGIASGPVVAGVVGRAKFFYDVWGDAVNTAARMEQTAEPGTIQVAPEMRELLTDRFELQERGLVEVRGKGEMRTWLLVGRKH
jgi:adenylate cyclase